MFTLIRKSAQAVADLPRRAHVWVLVKTDECMSDPRQRRLVALGAALTVGGLLATRAAHADGFADMGTKAAEQGTSLKTSFGTLLQAASVPAGGYGAINWFKKGKEGESSRISAGQIVIPLLAGAGMAGTGYLLSKAGETVGIATTQG